MVIQHKFSKKLRRSILTGYSQFMSGDENGADPSYVGNDDVNTSFADAFFITNFIIVKQAIVNAYVVVL